jgi:hypothetical protein
MSESRQRIGFAGIPETHKAETFRSVRVYRESPTYPPIDPPQQAPLILCRPRLGAAAFRGMLRLLHTISLARSFRSDEWRDRAPLRQRIPKTGALRQAPVSQGGAVVGPRAKCSRILSIRIHLFRLLPMYRLLAPEPRLPQSCPTMARASLPRSLSPSHSLHRGEDAGPMMRLRYRRG